MLQHPESLVAACGISSLTRDGTWALCTGNAESFQSKDTAPLGKSLIFLFSLLYLINYFYRRIILYKSDSRGSIDIDNDKIDAFKMKPRNGIASPGLIQDPWGWCTGMTQRDGTGREVGGGFRMGNMCTPVADSC